MRTGSKPRSSKKTKASVLHVTPFHSFPSGVIADVSKRNEYLEWAIRRNGVLIEDKIGYMVLPEHLLNEFEEKLGFYSCTVPVFEQYVLAELIESGDFERHINRMRRARRNSVL